MRTPGAQQAGGKGAAQQRCYPPATLGLGGVAAYTFLSAARSMCEVSIFALTGLAMLSAMGMSPTSLGWLSGMFGIGFGFASQEVVQNFLGGIMIALLRPFSAGDKISVSNEMIEDTVSGVVQVCGPQTLIHTL